MDTDKEYSAVRLLVLAACHLISSRTSSEKYKMILFETRTQQVSKMHEIPNIIYLQYPLHALSISLFHPILMDVT